MGSLGLPPSRGTATGAGGWGQARAVTGHGQDRKNTRAGVSMNTQTRESLSNRGAQSLRGDLAEPRPSLLLLRGGVGPEGRLTGHRGKGRGARPQVGAQQLREEGPGHSGPKEVVPVAWSSQGRHHCLRGGDEPRGLPGPVEGRGEREPAGRGAGRAWAAPPNRGGLAVPWGAEDSPRVQADGGRLARGPQGRGEHVAQDRRAHTAQTRQERAPAVWTPGPRGPVSPSHSPGSWGGPWGSWGRLRPARLCLCFSCLARMRSILGGGGGSEHRAGRESPGPPTQTAPTVSSAGPGTSPPPCDGARCS